MPEPVIILGAGGHALVCVATLQDAGRDVVAIYDDSPEAHGQRILGVPVVGAVKDAADRDDVTAVIAIGNNHTRAALAARCSLRWTTAVHPTAYIHPSARIGEGTVVFAGAIVQPQATLGRHVIVNTGATVDHDCVLGDFAHVGPGAHLCGAVHIGTGTLVGVGASARPGANVGEWSVVGAGAAVVGTLPAQIVAVGVPATIKGRAHGAP